MKSFASGVRKFAARTFSLARLHWACLLLVVCSSVQVSFAQDYPARPIRFIVPFGAGGSTDIAGRVLASEMSTVLNQPVVVENRPGAAGVIGVDAVAKSKPDGYTIGLSGVGPTVLVPLLDPEKMPYKRADLVNIGVSNTVEIIFVNRSEFPAKTMAEVIATAKKMPDKMTVGISGQGGYTDLEFLRLGLATGVQFLPVSFSGDAAIVNEIAAGRLDLGLITPPPVIPLVNAGKIKVIAAGGPSRSVVFPNAPLVRESGVPGYDAAYAWNILVAPTGTPASAVTTLNAVMDKALKVPAVVERMRALGIAPAGGSIQAANEFIQAEWAKWEKVVQSGKLKR